MMKNFINKILDVPKLIRRIWLLLWILLAILLIMKFCFGIWYPVVSNNKIFNDVCNFIDDNMLVYKIICFVLYFISLNFLCLTSMGKKKYKSFKEFVLINTMIITCGIVKILNSLVGNILEIAFYFIALPIINLLEKNFDKKWKNIIMSMIIYLIINLWTFNILIVRNTSKLVLNEMPMLVGLIIMLDYYIFIIILWIGVSYMGWFSLGWFFSKDVTVLKAEREKELAKKNPNMDKVAKIDEYIKELEKEEK